MKTFNGQPSFLAWFMALLFSGLLAACGGGSSQEVAPPSAPVPTVVSVAVTPTTASIPTNGVQAFVAVATFSDGSTRDVSATANWTTATAGVATVAPTTGVVTGVSSGSSAITASFGGKSSAATVTVTAASLVSISITPGTATVPINGVQAFTATAMYNDGSVRDVTSYAVWASGTTSVGTVVQSTGVVTGLSSGSTQLTASFGGKTSGASLTVTPATLVSVTVTPTAATLPIASTQMLTAKATYSDGAVLDVTNSAVWGSSAPLVASVSANTGVVTGISSGVAVVTAALGGKSGSATLTVPAVTLSAIAVSPALATAKPGDSKNFVATATYSDGSTANLTIGAAWTSSTPLVATVVSNTGVASALSAGSTIITASANGKSGSATLTVTAVTLSSISVSPASATAQPGDSKNFVATGTYSDGSTSNLTTTAAWTSATPLVATVFSNTGVASALSAGSTLITASVNGKSGSATLTVTPAVGRAGVGLGSSGNFVALAKTGISTTGTTAIVGDIGVSPAAASLITGFGLIADATNTFATSSLVTGKVYAANYAAPTPTYMTTAIGDMQAAFSDAAGRTLPDFTELGAGNISGMTLIPGLYKWGTGVLVTGVGVTLSGGPNDVWIFQVAQDLTISNSAMIILSGGAQAKNVYWQVSGKATLGTAANFSGVLMSQTLISVGTGAVVNGRLMAQSAITLDAARITAP